MFTLILALGFNLSLALCLVVGYRAFGGHLLEAYGRLGRVLAGAGISIVVLLLGALVLSLGGLPVAEYAPNAVKKTVIGVGHGDKKQIHMMVKVLLPKASFDGDDAADALAIAICHAHHRQSLAARLAIA